MNILDHLLEHDAAAIRQLLAACRGVSDGQWHQAFDFGQGGLYSTFDHSIDSMEYWTTLMQGRSWDTFTPPSDPTHSTEGISQRFEALFPVLSVFPDNCAMKTGLAIHFWTMRPASRAEHSGLRLSM